MKRLPALFLLLLSVAFSLSAQQIKEMEFRNQQISDILLVLAEMAGTSIVPDETVTGTASYYFTDTDFDTALRLFLDTYKYNFRKENKIYYVSRIKTEYDKDRNQVSMDADEVDITLLVRSVSKQMGKTILYDSLPRSNLTVHIKDASPEDVIKILIRRFPEYVLEAEDSFYYIRKQDQAVQTAGKQGAVQEAIRREGDLYSIKADKSRFFELIATLFRLEGKEYSLLLKNDSIIENLNLQNKPFPELLSIILEQANADYTFANNICYIFDIQRNDILKQYKNTEVVQLKYISVEDLPSLFPQDLVSGNMFKIDKKTNAVILRGSGKEIDPIYQFLKQIDIPKEGRSYYRYDLKYLTVKDFIPLLPKEYAELKAVTIPNVNSFIIPLYGDEKVSLDAYISLVDTQKKTFPVTLQYIRSEDLMKNLPPSISKEDIAVTGNQSLIFYVGTDEKRESFLKELKHIDKPIPQIRYELLVIQYQEGSSLTWNRSLETSPTATGDDGSGEDGTDEGDGTGTDGETDGSAAAGAVATAATTVFMGAIGELLNLNFDIVSTFGYQFALKLSLELGENNAQIMADTTLNGLSGEQIKFQNTNTYRYRDVEVDPDTGEQTTTGVTREITSGLIININGWVSGNGMITMEVAATVSKRGADVSTTTGNPPTTSEKVVSTHVRTISGEPVIISGLIQNELNESEKKIPGLGDIPVLGLPFKNLNKTKETSEMVIYIVPHLELSEREDEDLGSKLESIYKNLVAGRP